MIKPWADIDKMPKRQETCVFKQLAIALPINIFKLRLVSLEDLAIRY